MDFKSQFTPSMFPQEQVHSYEYTCTCGALCSEWTPLKDGKPAQIRKLCDLCDDAEYAARKLARLSTQHEHRHAMFVDTCPEEYLDSDPNRLPETALRIMMLYEMTDRGILCMGDSRKGKTRCSWLLLKKLVMQGHGVEAITEVEFSIKTSSFKTSEEIRKRLCHAPMLFIDDLGHVAAGQKHLSELYHIVEYRTSHKKPIICTTQFSGAELTERSQRNKTMTAIIGRLREFCDIVRF